MNRYTGQVGEKVEAALAGYPVSVDYGDGENGGFVQVVIPLVTWGESGQVTAIKAAVMAGWALANIFEDSPKPRFIVNEGAVRVWLDI